MLLRLSLVVIRVVRGRMMTVRLVVGLMCLRLVVHLGMGPHSPRIVQGGGILQLVVVWLMLVLVLVLMLVVLPRIFIIAVVAADPSANAAIRIAHPAVRSIIATPEPQHGSVDDARVRPLLLLLTSSSLFIVSLPMSAAAAGGRVSSIL